MTTYTMYIHLRTGPIINIPITEEKSAEMQKALESGEPENYIFDVFDSDGAFESYTYVEANQIAAVNIVNPQKFGQGHDSDVAGRC